MDVPEWLRWLEAVDGGRDWLDHLPNTLIAAMDTWGLELAGAPMPGFVSYVVPVMQGSTPRILKLQWPDEESAHEADALRRWDGHGGVRLLAHDPAHHALLLERCVPGTPLAAAEGIDRLGVVIGLLPRLWVGAGSPFRSLTTEAHRWRDGLPAAWEAAGRPCERALVDAAIALLDGLTSDQPDQVLLHQDLHAGNVLAAEREPWLAIDPKPIAGERSFGVAPIMRDAELGHSRRDLMYRLDRLSAELGLDRQRAAGWTIAQTMAWCFDSPFREFNLETVRWLMHET
jgi:streptomycin 6-kinase